MIRLVRLAVAVLAPLPLFLCPVPTFAEANDSPSAESATNAIEEISNLATNDDPVIVSDDAVTFASDLVSVEVPTDPSEGVVITTSGGDQVGLGLPGASQADEGVAAPVCVAIGARLVFDAVLAGRYYENGNCLKYRISFPLSANPLELKRGTYNCA